MIVKENIEFKRGRDSKESLEIGFQGLPRMFDELLKFPGLIQIGFDNYPANKENVDSIIFQMEKKTDWEDIPLDIDKPSGLNKFLEDPSIGYDDDKIFFEYHIKPEFKSLFRKYIDIFGDSYTKSSEHKDVLIPPPNIY